MGSTEYDRKILYNDWGVEESEKIVLSIMYQESRSIPFTSLAVFKIEDSFPVKIPLFLISDT